MSRINDLRTDITEAKVMASLVNAAAATPNVSLQAAIAEVLPIAQTAKSLTTPLICRYTGITVGSVNVQIMAGHMPMIGQWKNSMVTHPIFSLNNGALLSFARNTWFRFCSFDSEEALNETLTSKQEQALRVTALAMLHQLTEVRQEVVWLPEWKDVVNNWPSLMAISYWRAYLESERFKFPTIRLSKWEPTLNLHEYLQACWKIKKDYETQVIERVEQAKLAAHEKATLALRDEIAGKSPRSARLLWKWFVKNLPSRYESDTEGWMKTIFFAPADKMLDFTLADLDLFEEITLCEVPTGTSVSHAFLDILASKRALIETHHATYEIVIPASIAADVASGEISEIEPKRGDYANKLLYMQAMAKWRLSKLDAKAILARSETRQATITVKPSHVPKFELYQSDDEQAADAQENDYDIPF